MHNTDEDLRIAPVSDYIPSLEKILNSQGIKPELSIQSLPKFSEKIHGLHRGTLLTIGGRPSHGKSAFALQICFDIAKQGKNVLFLSLEVSSENLVARMFCQEFEVNNEEFYSDGFANHRDKFEKFKEVVADMPLIISDCIGRTHEEIEEVLSCQAIQPDVVCLDYINAIKGYGAEKLGKIDEFVRNYREQSIRYNFAGIMVCQINRIADGSDDREPKLYQLKGSGFIEEHSDQVALLYYQHKYTHDVEHDKYKNKMFLEKNRDGNTGFVDFRFEPQFYKFYDTTELRKKESKSEVREWQE